MSQRNTDVTPQAADTCEQIWAEMCTLRQVLDHVAGKWSISILLAAMHEPVRFSELERAIDGISRRMLTLTLRNLERDGLLTRTVYPTVPPKVEYLATDMARELHASLASLTDWAERHLGDIATARSAYDGKAYDGKAYDGTAMP
jgi:DNA-binding HxlR family transcriptional regulator